MSKVVPPGNDGYGWRMEDSERLRAHLARRASTPPRAPIQDVVAQLAARDAARRGTDPEKLLARMNDPELGDRLLAEAEAEATRERLARQADILLSRLPSQYRHADFPRNRFGWEARQWLAEYRQITAAVNLPRIGPTPPPVPPSLVILGDTGAGKTWTACAIAHALLTEDCIPVTVTTVSDMMESIKPGGNGLDTDMMQYALAPVLVLDDLGAERQTEWTAEQLHRLAHTRSHNGRPVIVTSNLSGPEIRERYNQRTVERLFGGAKLIQIDGETRRPMPL